MTQRRKKIIIVLGMHRSGTSVLSRSLEVMNVDLGNNLSPAMEGINPKGFWEDMDVINFNENILSSLLTAWHYLLPISVDDVDELNRLGFLEQAVQILEQKLSGTQVFGLKDPRLCKLLPFWKQVFSRLNLDVTYLIALRNPLSVAQSLRTRDGFPTERGILLWLDHILSSLEQTQGERRMIIDYDSMLENPGRTLFELGKFLELETNLEELARFQDDFLDKNLRHAAFKVNDLLENGLVSNHLVYDVYITLLKKHLIPYHLWEDDFSTKTNCWIEEIKSQKNSWSVINHYVKALSECDAQMKEIYRSKAWRFVLWVRRLRVAIAPPGSLRARTGQLAFSVLMQLMRKIRKGQV